MKDRINSPAIYKKRAVVQDILFVLAGSALLMVMLAALLVNTVDMDRQLRKNTEQYADDVSSQLASNISSRMEMREIYMRNLADTFSRMPGEMLTEELLERKADYLGMDMIFLLHTDGTTVPAAASALHPELKGELQTHASLFREASILHTDHEEIWFSSPVLWQDGREASVLVGVRSNETLQKMLQEVDFKNQGLSCIVDTDGTMVVSATDETPFVRLKDLFAATPEEERDAVQRQMLQNIKEGKSGVMQVEDVGEGALIFGYDFLGINDWVLLTLLPSDLFSEGMEQNLFQYLLIIGCLALGILVFFICIGRSYQRSFRRVQGAALTDLLTGGKNRTAFQMEAEVLFRKKAWRDLAIVYMNIRGFKRFNEKFGSETGDALLRQIHSTLQACLQEGELACRAEEDHFFLLLTCAGEEEIPRRVSFLFARLDEQLPRRFFIDSSRLSVGAYFIREPEQDFTVLIDRAKRSGDQAGPGELRLYDAAFEQQTAREYLLDDTFQHAIEHHEFQLYLQPQVRPGQKQASGGEVLVRWQHPEFGMIFPGEFIPLLERNGKICDLDFYMFEETCKLLQTWLAEGRAIPLSVNLSRVHLIAKDLSFLDRFRSIKEAYQIPDGLIDLELTESLMLEHQEIPLVVSMIDRAREMGFLCSIDDFGFGYSSLTMLKDLNVTTVKLDRQFFWNESEKSWMVVRQLIHLAHDLGMHVVAEGVEVQEQVERLRACGCDLIQGYVYARPMPILAFEQWSADEGE